MLIAAEVAASPFVQSIARQEIILHGKKAYQIRCAGCHGNNGMGDGERAADLTDD